MNKLSIKMLLMVLITSAATIIADQGFPVGVGWWVLAITVVGTSVTHLAQSVFLPTQTDMNKADITDIIKGAVVALGNFLSMWGASYLPGAHVDFNDLLKSAGMVFIMYILKQIKTQPIR